MACACCEGSGWVCENHPDMPAEGAHACRCGGAGMPCPACNASRSPRLPSGFVVDAAGDDANAPIDTAPISADQKLLVETLKAAARVIAEHLEPGHPSNADDTLSRLIHLIDNQQIAAAVERLDAGFGLRVVK